MDDEAECPVSLSRRTPASSCLVAPAPSFGSAYLAVPVYPNCRVASSRLLPESRPSRRRRRLRCEVTQLSIGLSPAALSQKPQGAPHCQSGARVATPLFFQGDRTPYRL